MWFACVAEEVLARQIKGQRRGVLVWCDDRRSCSAEEFPAAFLGLRDFVENPFVDACVMHLVNILE